MTDEYPLAQAQVMIEVLIEALPRLDGCAPQAPADEKFAAKTSDSLAPGRENVDNRRPELEQDMSNP